MSLSTGNSILPKILGPVSFSAWMFSITGLLSLVEASSATDSVIAVGATTGSCFLDDLDLVDGVTSAGAIFSATGSTIFFFVPFLGLVEESITAKSILSKTLGPSSSGASIFTISEVSTACFFSSTNGVGFTTFGSSTGFTASTFGSSLKTVFFSSFLK